MEFGVLGLDGFSSNRETKQKPITSDITLDFSPPKVAKVNGDYSPFNNGSLRHSSYVLSNEQQERNMLSFSSPKLEKQNFHNSPFAYFQHPNPSHSKNAGYSSNGSLNATMCLLNGVKWPFTTSQWLELEQQALIYKYIIANEPIPPNHLIPIKRALESAGFCSFPAGLLSLNTYGWSPFQLRFSNNNDPEPGRCRRTDGKKWRCSRDAVLDQKYCERHINRGRHRSRKPVEPLSGHSLSKSPCNNSSFSSPALAASNTVSVSQKYSKEFHSNVSNHMTTPTVSRLQVR